MQRISTAENGDVLRQDFGAFFALVNAPSHYFFRPPVPGLSQLAMLTEMESRITGIATIGYPLHSLNV
jgi:hypothetical protein